jgi:hypothetical protein
LQRKLGAEMDIRKWSGSGRRTIQLGEYYEEVESARARLPSARSNKLMRWKVLWMKLKKERRRMFDSPAPIQIPYDPYTYSQNFDQGSAWDEPDILSRSFSARFADPSRIFRSIL